MNDQVYFINSGLKKQIKSMDFNEFSLWYKQTLDYNCYIFYGYLLKHCLKYKHIWYKDYVIWKLSN